jgi:hypothetical protein
MKLEHLQFLASVEDFVKKNPELMGQLIQAAQSGVNARLQETHSRAVDMETVAAIALDARLFKKRQWHLAELLSKWEGRTNLVFTELVTKLRDSQKQ